MLDILSITVYDKFRVDWISLNRDVISLSSSARDCHSQILRLVSFQL